jgi:hypothetical protein
MNTLQALYENFGQLFENFGEFKDNFFDITRGPYTAMLYIQDIDNVADNYLYYRSPDTTHWDYVLDY